MRSRSDIDRLLPSWKWLDFDLLISLLKRNTIILRPFCLKCHLQVDLFVGHAFDRGSLLQ